MKQIRFSLNLDNIRGFLYGAGESERYSSPALQNDGKNAAAEVPDREKFIKRHFGESFHTLMFDEYACTLEDKRKTELITEVCVHKGENRGQKDLLNKISQKYDAKEPGFTVDELIRLNEAVLSQTDISRFDAEILGFIQDLKELDSINGTADSKYIPVRYVMEYIRNIAAVNERSEPRAENSARVLALLLLSALLWEKFPVTILSDKAVFTSKQRYHLDNLFAGIQNNLGMLGTQLMAQRFFLKCLDEKFLAPVIEDSADNERKLGDLRTVFSEQLLIIDKADKMLDRSSLEAECEGCGLSCDRRDIVFLHSAAYSMDVFAHKAMERVMEYVSLAVNDPSVSFSGVSKLAKNYKECLKQYREIVYLNIAALSVRLPYDAVKDLFEQAELFFADDNGALLSSPAINEQSLYDRADSIERDFRQTVCEVSADLPDIFNTARFTKKTAEPLPDRERNSWSVSDEYGECAEKAVIGLLADILKQMDRLCYLHSIILGILSDASKTGIGVFAAGTDDLRGILGRYKHTLKNISALPPLTIEQPLYGYMEEKNIKTLEFRTMCSYIYELAAQYMLHITKIEKELFSEKGSAEILQQNCLNAWADHSYHIAYINTFPVYFLAGWDSKWTDCLSSREAEFKVLCVKPEKWAETQAEAERVISAVLDNMENTASELNRRVTKEEWDIIKLKSCFDRLSKFSESSSAAENRTPPHKNEKTILPISL